MGKDSFIKVRVSDEEKHDITLKAKDQGMSVSDLIRRQLMAKPITDSHQADLEAFRERTQQLARIGNNLNQLARGMHQGKQPPAESLLAIADALRGLQ